MNLFSFTKLGRALSLTAVLAVGSVCWLGCGEDDDNFADNTCTSGGSCKTATMPDGKIWTTENLNYQTADSWCYDGSPDNCRKYGRLYTWESAKSACQSIGMKLPTREEWDALVMAAGGRETAGKKLKSKNGWYDNGNVTDEYGFSALPGGSRDSDGFDYAGGYGYWWTATEAVGIFAYGLYMYYRDGYVFEDYHYKSDAFSARCVQE